MINRLHKGLFVLKGIPCAEVFDDLDCNFNPFDFIFPLLYHSISTRIDLAQDRKNIVELFVRDFYHLTGCNLASGEHLLVE